MGFVFIGLLQDILLMQDCQPKVSQCPSCRDRHIDCRSIIAEKLLEATLKAISDSLQILLLDCVPAFSQLA
jgi:hypothetical protein